MEIHEYLKSKCIPTLPAMAIPDPNKAPPERVVRNPFSRRPRTKTDLAPRYRRLVNGSIDIMAKTNIPAETFNAISYHPFTSIILFCMCIRGNVFIMHFTTLQMFLLLSNIFTLMSRFCDYRTPHIPQNFDIVKMVKHVLKFCYLILFQKGTFSS